MAPLPLAALLPLMAAVLLLRLGRRMGERPSAAQPNPSTEPSPLPVLGFAWTTTLEEHGRSLALAAAALLTWVNWQWLPAIPQDGEFGLVTWSWLAAIGLFLAAIPAPRPKWSGWRVWWRAHWQEALTAVAIGLLALALRAWRLGSIPYTLGGDEGSQGLEAARVLNGQIRSPFSAGWLGVPTMSFMFNSLSIRWLGRTAFALRLPWTLVGALSVVATYFLARRLKGNKWGWLTAVLVATYHFHIHFSRLGSNQIADTLFMPLALFFLVRAMDEDNRRDWALSGVISGLALYFYAGARLTPLVMLAVLAYALVREPRRFWRKYGTGTAALVIAFFITGAPMIQYALNFPDDFNARVNQVAIIQSGWLEREVAVRGQSAAVILFDQFRRAALAFNYYADRTTWYGLREPLLSPFFGAVFLMGLGYATLRLLGRRPDARSAPMVAWWWGGMLLGGMLTESPPSSQRLITLAIPVCYFIVLAIGEILELAKTAVRGVPERAVWALLVALFSLSSIATYFLDYTPQRIYGGPHAAFATEIAPTLNELALTNRFYFVGAPWMYWGFATLPYLVPGAKAVDVIEPETAVSTALSYPDDGRGAVFIFLPQRLLELTAVAQAFPGGESRPVYSPVNGESMGLLYLVPAGHHDRTTNRGANE